MKPIKTKKAESLNGTYIKQIKDLTGATSEELFGIDEQPEAQCRSIDSIIGCFMVFEASARALDSFNSNDIDEALELMKDCASDIDCNICIDEMEDLRTNIEQLRLFGQGWKNIAKDLLEKYPEEIENYIADGFYDEVDIVIKPAKIK